MAIPLRLDKSQKSEVESQYKTRLHGFLVPNPVQYQADSTKCYIL